MQYSSFRTSCPSSTATAQNIHEDIKDIWGGGRNAPNYPDPTWASFEVQGYLINPSHCKKKVRKL